MQNLESKGIKVWMRTFMQQSGMSANEWATKAGTSPTNITRFLNSDSKFIPSARTIAKLASVAKSQPSFGLQAALSTVPVMNADGEIVDMIDDPRKGKVLAFKMGEVTGYGQAGIFSYDYVIVEPNAKINDGDVILIKDKKRGLLCCDKAGDIVLFRGSDHLKFDEFKPRKLKTVEVIGKVIQSIRKYE